LLTKSDHPLFLSPSSIYLLLTSSIQKPLTSIYRIPQSILTMLRQSVTRPLSTTSRAILTRPFSAIAPRMGEGDTGAPRPGGAAHRCVYKMILLLSTLRLSKLRPCSISLRFHALRSDDVISSSKLETTPSHSVLRPDR
jgi:hypothetical protein